MGNAGRYNRPDRQRSNGLWEALIALAGQRAEFMAETAACRNR
jgi:hypothetical protein